MLGWNASWVPKKINRYIINKDINMSIIKLVAIEKSIELIFIPKNVNNWGISDESFKAIWWRYIDNAPKIPIITNKVLFNEKKSARLNSIVDIIFPQ